MKYKSNSDPDEDEEDDENEDYETDSLAMNKSKKRRTSSSSLSSRPSSSSKKMRGKYVSRRRAVTDLEKRMAAEAAFSFASKKPYCMIHMSANMVYRWASLVLCDLILFLFKLLFLVLFYIYDWNFLLLGTH